MHWLKGNLRPYAACLLVLCTFCVLPQAGAWQNAAKRATPSAGQSQQDACALLSHSEIEKVQGERVQQTKATSTKSAGVIVSQCFYSLPTFSNSISVAETLPDPGNPAHTDARELWGRFFHQTADSDKDSGSPEDGSAGKDEEKEAASPPVRIPGLGEEAYWIHSFVGTLYVLKANAFLRISIGGKGEDAARLRKARTLAEDALKRMP